MFKDLILQNPIMALLLTAILIIGVVWLILHTFHLKPRDSRIKIMEKNIYILRNEILKIKKREQANKKSKENISSKNQKQSGLSQDKHSKKGRAKNGIILNDLQGLLDLWNSKELADLQKTDIENTYTNKSVMWEVLIKSVDQVKDGKIYVRIISPKATFSFDLAVAYFEDYYQEALLLIKKEEIVVISGVIERFFLSPILKDCTIIKK